MCINLLTKYDCGHESVSSLTCQKRPCKKNEKHIRPKSHACTKCGNAYMAQLQEECDDAKRRLQDADSAFAQALERADAIEIKFEVVKVQKHKLAKQLKALSQENSNLLEREGVSLRRVEALHLELEATRSRIPKNEYIFTEILRYFACGHDTAEICSTKGVAKEDCHYKQVLGSESDKLCADCQMQEKAHYEAAIMGFTGAQEAQEGVIYEPQSKTTPSEERYTGQELSAKKENEPVREPVVADESLHGSQDSLKPLRQSEELEARDIVENMDMIKTNYGFLERQESVLLGVESSVDEVHLMEKTMSLCEQESTPSVPCFATMNEHFEKDLLEADACAGALQKHGNASASVHDLKFKSKMRSYGSKA